MSNLGSGHGGRADDRSGDELTGKAFVVSGACGVELGLFQDDTLIPCDFQSAGIAVTADAMDAVELHRVHATVEMRRAN